MVKVLYVDFGNTEDVPVTNLREPTEENVHVLSLPFQVLSSVITEKILCNSKLGNPNPNAVILCIPLFSSFVVGTGMSAL